LLACVRRAFVVGETLTAECRKRYEPLVVTTAQCERLRRGFVERVRNQCVDQTIHRGELCTDCLERVSREDQNIGRRTLPDARE
jgi:hypothetical protein